MKQFRQGDVFIEEVAKPKGYENAKKVATDNGRIVLAYGEVTGHAHAIRETPGLALLELDSTSYLDVKEPAQLRHEEHGTINIPVIADPDKTYRVRQQREYTPEAIRNVRD